MAETELDFGLILEHAGPWTLVLFRMLGIFLTSPLLSSMAMPVQAKVMLAVAMAAAVYAVLPESAREPRVWGMMTLAAVVLGEFLIGIILGYMSGVPFMTVETSGHIMGYMMGFQLAQAFNPELEANLNVIGSLLFYLAVAAYLLMGGLSLTFESLLYTFESVPAGELLTTDVPLEIFVGMVTASFDIALSIAAPVLGSGFLLLLTLGFVMKTMPQINVMTAGFSFKIMVGLLMLVFAVFAIEEALGEHVMETLRETRDWVRSLSA